MKDDRELAAIAELLDMAASCLVRRGSGSSLAFATARDALEWALGLPGGSERTRDLIAMLLDKMSKAGQFPFGLGRPVGVDEYLALAVARMEPGGLKAAREAAAAGAAAPAASCPAPPKPGACPECGVAHEPDSPHTETNRYRDAFQAKHGRAPTWDDQAAHCPASLLASWDAALARRERQGRGSH